MTPPRMQAILECVDGGRVLDVGAAGNAVTIDDEHWLHRKLDRRAEEVVAVDTDHEGVTEMRARGYEAIHGDAQALVVVDGPFDVVVAAEVIEHLGDPGALFDAAADVLAPRGRLLVSTPNMWAVVYLRRALTGGVPADPAHTCWFDRETLLTLAQRRGFDGEVEYVRPEAGGLSALVYRLGVERLGGTRLVGEFSFGGEQA